MDIHYQAYTYYDKKNIKKSLKTLDFSEKGYIFTSSNKSNN